MKEEGSGESRAPEPSVALGGFAAAAAHVADGQRPCCSDVCGIYSCFEQCCLSATVQLKPWRAVEEEEEEVRIQRREGWSPLL